MSGLLKERLILDWNYDVLKYLNARKLKIAIEAERARNQINSERRSSLALKISNNLPHLHHPELPRSEEVAESLEPFG